MFNFFYLSFFLIEILLSLFFHPFQVSAVLCNVVMDSFDRISLSSVIDQDLSLQKQIRSKRCGRMGFPINHKEAIGRLSHFLEHGFIECRSREKQNVGDAAGGRGRGLVSGSEKTNLSEGRIGRRGEVGKGMKW